MTKSPRPAPGAGHTPLPGAGAPVERLWQLADGPSRRTANLVRLGRIYELHLVLNGQRYFLHRCETRAAALAEARYQRERWERAGWRPVK